MNFYISDVHFGHKNAIEFDKRPFADVAEMDRVMIENWNRRVSKNDHVYIIGDLIYRSGHEAEWYLKKLNGHLHLILGNHDGIWLKQPGAREYFEEIDEFKAPMLTYNEEREYTELQNKPFPTAMGTGTILKTIQTIKFELNEKGGKIKSEAAMDMQNTAAIIIDKKPQPRYFYVDDTFAIFLREKGKAMPYFAGRVEDITKYQ